MLHTQANGFAPGFFKNQHKDNDMSIITAGIGASLKGGFMAVIRDGDVSLFELPMMVNEYAYDAPAIIRMIRDNDVGEVVMERLYVGSRTSPGAAAYIGRAHGGAEAAAHASGRKVTIVRNADLKSHLGIPFESGSMIEAALRMYPEHAKASKARGAFAAATALLLARYGYQRTVLTTA